VNARCPYRANRYPEFMTNGYQALRHGVAWLDLRPRGRILAKGRDRARFLHNVTSNEVKKMAPGDTCYAFLLNPQGRIQGDLSLLCLPDHFLIDTEPELREKVRQQILRYKVADQIELEDVTDQTAAIGVEGPSAETVRIEGEHTAAPFTATGQPGYRIYCPLDQFAETVRLLEAAGARPATEEDARAVRIENGKPRFGEDILETSLVQETQQMQAVSFSKGCYLGQEIVERVRARGHVNKKLVRLLLDGPAGRGDKLVAAAAEVGEITSAVLSPESGKTAALAYVRTPHDAPGVTLELAANPGTLATVV
jgi:folate-binding protein YgfZ